MLEQEKKIEEKMGVRKCKKTFRVGVKMKLLAFLLIITEIFILFNPANGYQDDHKRGNNHGQPTAPFIVHSSEQQDNISSSRHRKLAQVIRVSGIDIATAATQLNVSLEEGRRHHHNQEEIVPYSAPYPSSSHLPQALKNKTETLDRYHHSSKQLEDINALADDRTVAGKRESNPLIEQRHATTTLRRNKRQLDNEEADLASVAIASAGGELEQPFESLDDDGFLKSVPFDDTNESNNDSAQVNEPKLPSEHRVYLQSKHYQQYHGHHHHHHRNIRPHFSVENHEGESGIRFRNKNGFCHRDCSGSSSSSVGLNEKDSYGASNNGINGQRMAEQPPLDAYKICASNGQFYGSICELRRHSCRQNIHLSRRPRAFCLQQQQQLGQIDASSLSMMNNHLNGTDEVRIVELKRRCNTFAYTEMKSLLVREFNGDISSMFRYFDSNGDNYIEAHELWPKQDYGSNKLLYAQVWVEHSSKCRHNSSDNKHRRYARLSNQRSVEDPTKCWYFLDFAFEPQFASNPCSLSHLMLFDLKHPNNRFDLETFREAFEEPRVAWITGPTESFDNISSTAKKRSTTKAQMMLGDSISLSCLLNFTGLELIEISNLVSSDGLDDGIRCLWTRYDLNLGAIQDPHIHIEKQRITKSDGISFYDLTLHLKDAQLYLSGHFRCACHSKKIERTFERSYSVQVSAKPRVDIRPKFQWSLPASRISFECHYDYIDTKLESSSDDDKTRNDGSQVAHSRQADLANELVDDNGLGERGQFGLRVKWLKDDSELVVDSKEFNGLNQSQLQNVAASANDNGPTIVSNGSDSGAGNDEEDSFYSAAYDRSLGRGARYASSAFDDDGGVGDDTTTTTTTTSEHSYHREKKSKAYLPKQPSMSYSSLRASITMAASRLTLENLTMSDSGTYTCHVDVPSYRSSINENSRGRYAGDIILKSIEISGQSDGTLLVQEQPKSDQSGSNEIYGTNLWMFHDNGISIYRLQNDDGQEMELLREINGHSLVSGEVDGNWNQLTLCGGLNPEQVVICEWSDNALHIDVQDGLNSKTSKYIYVGQPNLNRIIVMDGLKFEIVAIINTEPQPRKLYLYKPSKIHLSKWVRRRLSPAANARWLDAIGTHAHSLKSTPESKLYSMATAAASKSTKPSAKPQRFHAGQRLPVSRERRASMLNQKLAPLIQHDIWLLCYGQPLVVDPSGDEHLEEASRFYSTFVGGETHQKSRNTTTTTKGHKQGQRSNVNSVVQPFTPRLTARAPFSWPVWPNKESKLWNRKSVHIIQSTFFPSSTLTDDSLHNHDRASEEEGAVEASPRWYRNDTVVSEFKKSTVLTTHHLFSGITASLGAKPAQLYLARPQLDLIQDLYVPPKPYSLESNDGHKIHYAYVTHYDDRRLFRVSMDEYRYDREIDLQNCDPINLVTTAQGLLVIQCRAPIAHNLIGQMVLDQLTSTRIEFNGNIRAQESYLSPDHRYLVSIFNNSTLISTATSASQPSSAGMKTQSNYDSGTSKLKKRSTAPRDANEMSRQSIIYVQLVTMSGLKLQYEIKTSLEISQCSFVWKDGYYAAIFVSTNRRDDQSEILSLRLADSRLQLMARVPGLISAARHKDQLIVSPELRLAALSTNLGTYVVDLEDNRVSQSLRHHQSPPTLLWV